MKLFKDELGFLLACDRYGHIPARESKGKSERGRREKREGEIQLPREEDIFDNLGDKLFEGGNLPKKSI